MSHETTGSPLGGSNGNIETGTGTPEPGAGLRRRSVVASAAWTVPAVAVAASAPMAAASIVDGLSIKFTKYIYDINPNDISTELATIVTQTTGGVSSPVAGATVTYVVTPVPAGEGGTGSGGGVEQPGTGGGQAGNVPPTATLPGGATYTANPTDPAGLSTIPTTTTGPGWGLVKITATVTYNGVTATTDAFIRISTQGPVWSFGSPAYGNLGNGNTAYQPTPAYVNYQDFDAVDIVGRYGDGAMLLNSAGEIYTWGFGGYGLNGQGSVGNQTSYYTPQKLVTAFDGQTFTSLSGGYYAMGAVDSNGGAYGWGINYYGVLTASTANLSGAVYTPTLIHSSLASGVEKLELSTFNGLALKDDGTVWSWGYNYYGSIGSSTVANGAYTTEPVQVTFPGDVKIVDIANGYAAGYAVDENGDIWAWGSNDGYRLGVASPTFSLTPIKINGVGDTGYVAIESSPISYSAAAVKADGTAKFWGWNGYGQAGDGTSGNYVTTPQEIPLTDVAQIEINYHGTHVRKNDGTLWYTGWNGTGQAGIGSYDVTNVYRKVPNINGSVQDVATTIYTSYALSS